MNKRMRTMIARGFLGAGTIGLTLLGCSSRLGPVHAKQTTPWLGRPELPDVTVARAADCVAEYGSQLEPGYHTFDSKVLVDEDGDKEDVTIDDIPNTAYDLGACMRNALRAMPIAEEPLREGVQILKNRREQASVAQRSLMGTPAAAAVGVAIVVSELMLEAGAYTFLFAVTVEVLDKAAKDIAEGGKAGCAAHYAACMATSMSKKLGNHWRQSRCSICARVCVSNVVRNEGSWPSQVGNGSCEYWQQDWK